MPVRAAVVGTASYYSVNFARALRALPPERVQLVGAAHLGVDDETLARHTRLTRADFAERFGVKLFEKPEDLLSETHPDLVCVAAPDRQKPDCAVMALDAGADVYVSKPFAASAADAARIRDAARRHPARLAGGLNPARFARAIREAHDRTVGGEIGDVLTARAWIQHGAANPTANRRGSAEFDDGQGGIEYSLGVYAADLLNWFLDAARTPAVRTFAEYDNLNTRAPGYPWMDSGKAVVRYAADKLGSMDIYYSVPCGAPPWEIEVSGRDGIMRTNGGNYEGVVWRRSGLTRPRVEPFASTRDDTILAAIDHVVAACERRTPFEMDAEDAYRAVELCDAWTRSAASHEPVALPLP
ncbi:MAG TPA: Gfo/Idh/MocA family oxidoreductase, partial [Chloroflexota bacterium]|nr:Gfo/Idh/MocA family oxidoreductase [Chloroflexota bacterium]